MNSWYSQERELYYLSFMIDETIKGIMNRLQGYLSLQSGGSVTRGDIAQHESSEGSDLLENIIITLVNVEEENTLKNNYPVRIQNNIAVSEKPVLFLNLYLLFSAKYSNYDEALKHLGLVISFFQANNRLAIGTPNIDVICSLHNIGFENLNNLWTVLGGKYMPSVIYKVRMLAFQAAPPVGGPAIVEISESEKPN